MIRRVLPLVAVVILVAGCKGEKTSFTLGRCISAPAPRTAAVVDAARKLRVASINMWGIPYVSQYIEERFAALAKRLRDDPDVDVVGLEEVWDSDARERLLTALRPTFPYQADFHGDHGRSGLALVSRRPFAEAPRFVAFDDVGKWWKPWNGEWFGGKGVGAARVELEGEGSIWVAVTHLHACYDRGAPIACDESDEFAAYRRSQIARVREFVNDLAGDEPAVVLGDFNFTPTSRYFRELSEERTGNGFDPGWVHVEEPQAPATRIDHVWLRPGVDEHWRSLAPASVVYNGPIEVDGGAKVPLSDHCAIAATVGR